MEVTIRSVPAMRVAYTSYDGELDHVGKIFHRIQGWIMRQGETPEPIIGVFREEHQPVDEEGKPHGGPIGHAEAWVEFGKDPDPAVDEMFPDPLAVEIKDVPAVEVASVHFKGNPLEIARLVDQFRAFMESKGFTLGKDTRHVYRVMDPEDYDKWETEVQVPIESRP